MRPRPRRSLLEPLGLVDVLPTGSLRFFGGGLRLRSWLLVVVQSREVVVSHGRQSRAGAGYSIT
jgi:hypothetical protein